MRGASMLRQRFPPLSSTTAWRCLATKRQQRQSFDENSTNDSEEDSTITSPESKLILPSTKSFTVLTPRTDFRFDLDEIQTPSAQATLVGDTTSTLTTSAAVDFTSMYNPSIHLPHAPRNNWEGYEPPTPLSDHLVASLAVMGRPITVAEYMRLALQHPEYGYYTSKYSDSWDDNTTDDSSTMIGRKGDFVTAPELSQVFGESICVWFNIVWRDLKQPSNIHFIEIGPGTGSLMADVLRFAQRTNLTGISHVHLVETSRPLREIQRKTLMQPSLQEIVHLEFDASNDKKDDTDSSKKETSSNLPTVRVHWHDTLQAAKKYIAESCQDSQQQPPPVFVLCQELMDALPVHVFEKTEDGCWRERLVDVAVDQDFLLDEGTNQPDDSSTVEKKTRLRFVLAPEVTPALKLLLHVDDNGRLLDDNDDDHPAGQIVEICPDAILLAQDIAKLVQDYQGAALIIDYGQEGSADSLRGFSQHQQVSPLSRPGQVDVTTNVDFSALRHAVDRMRHDDDSKQEVVDVSKDVYAFGPVPQGQFLASMGAMERVMHLIESEETSEKEAENLFEAFKRLVLPEHMGEVFKVMAIARKRDGIYGPAGF